MPPSNAGRVRAGAKSPLQLSVVPLVVSLVVFLSACAGEPSFEASPWPESARREWQALQEQVDTVLVTTSVLRGSTEPHDAAVLRALEKLDVTVQQLSDAAQQLRRDGRLEAGREAAPMQLSVRAGQLLPELRALGRAVRASTPDDETRRKALLAIAQAQLAARSLDLQAGALQAEANGAITNANTNTNAESEGERSFVQQGLIGPVGPFYLIDEGHIDAIDAAWEDGQLGITIDDETVDPDVERDPKRTVLVVKATAKVSLPDARYGFIGDVGATAWLLPENQLDAAAAGLLWPGLATDEIEPGVFVNDTVQVSIRKVIGPNGLSLFSSPQDELSGPLVVADSEDGLPDIISLPASTHTHLNWAFESAGIYLVLVEVGGQLAGVTGTPWVTSSAETLKFLVLP